MSEGVIRVGTAVAAPGAYRYGAIPVLDLPTGGREEIPVVIAQGREPGPVLWVTANIHGGELTGIASLHALLTPALPGNLSGTLVALPTLNPAGLRVMQRYPYYEPKDPNRLWPAPRTEEEGEPARPAVYEQIARTLYDAILATRPDCLLDLHNASIDSVPFTIRDRVLYRTAEERERARPLAERLDGLARAFGLSVVNEVGPEKYVKQELHRSVAGSMVNTAGVPALTIELGMGMAIDPAAVRAGARGIRNVMAHLGMLPGSPEPIDDVPVVESDFAVRRDDSARAPVSGIVQSVVQPGQRFAAGDLLGRMVDLYGRPLEGGEIRAERDGWLIGWSNGIARYRGQVVASLAVRDDEDLICPWPDTAEAGSAPLTRP